MRATARNLRPGRSVYRSAPDRTESSSVQSWGWTASVGAMRLLHQAAMRSAAVMLLMSSAALSSRVASAQLLSTADAPVTGAFQAELAPATQIDPAAASLETQVAELRQQLEQLEMLRTDEAKLAKEAAAKKQVEQVTNDTNNIFTERSIPSQNVFAADQEVGLAFYNCTESKDITWTTGVFFDDLNDTFKTRVDNNQGLRLAGRLTWLPYYHASSLGRYLLHTGVGILHTEDFDDRVRFRTRPQVQRGPVLIDSRNLAAERYTTGNIEAALVWGPVTLQSEAFLSSVDMLTEERLNVGGAYAHLSYFLTGENRIFEPFGQHGPQFGRNKPSTNFFINRSGMGWGAWEAKVRWSLLDLSSANAGQYNDLSAGFNWYWSDRTRAMFDWIRPMTDNETVFGSTESDLLAMRFDFNW